MTSIVSFPVPLIKIPNNSNQAHTTHFFRNKNRNQLRGISNNAVHQKDKQIKTVPIESFPGKKKSVNFDSMRSVFDNTLSKYIPAQIYDHYNFDYFK